jgi:hypothetical protein
MESCVTEVRVVRSIFVWQNFAALGKIRSRENAMRTSPKQNSLVGAEGFYKKYGVY